MGSIFWSWQSDLDPRVTRNLVRDALSAAIGDLGAELEERHELTSDTQGVAGSPDIIATILAKIESATVFVGDVTPIAVSQTGKALANPNVLIELGYAKHAIGLARVLLVWNTAFEGATIDQLPFDMRGRRAPLAFHLEAGATRDQLRAEREKLRRELHKALQLSIAASLPPRSPPLVPEWHPVGPNAALWFDPSSELAINEDGVAGRKKVRPGPYSYVRILPQHWSAPAEPWIDEVRPAILGPVQGFSWGATRGGFLIYSGSLRAGDTPLGNMVMQFRKTGELWGVDSYIADDIRERFYADTTIANIHAFLKSNLSALARQGATGPFEVMLGVTEIEGLHWVSETGFGGRPRALEEEVRTAFTLTSWDEEQWLPALQSAWGEIAAAFGVPAPPLQTMLKQIRLR